MTNYHELAEVTKNEFILFISTYHAIVEEARNNQTFQSLHQTQQREVLRTQIFIVLNQINRLWSEERIELCLIILVCIQDQVLFSNTFTSAKMIYGGVSSNKKHVIVNTTEGPVEIAMEK